MFRRFFIAVSLVLLVAAATVPSQAQSGRDRQLRLQGLLQKESVAPAAINVQEEDRKIDFGFSKPSAIEVRRSGALIYNDAAPNQKKDDGEYHMTKGDKRVGWILLGLLVLGGIGQIAQE